MGLNQARTERYAIFYQNPDSVLMPLESFPPILHKPTMQELAKQMPRPRTLGERIRYFRLMKGLQQKELARSLRVYNSAVCQYELGHTEPTHHHLQRLVKILGVSASQLVPKNV